MFNNELSQCFSKRAKSPPLDDFDWRGGEKNKAGDKAANQDKGGENAPPLIDH